MTFVLPIPETQRGRGLILTVKHLLSIAIIFGLAPCLALANGNSCANEAKAVTDMRFTGAYEKSKMVIQLQERENVRQIARRIASSKVVTDEDMATLRKAMVSADESRKELDGHTRRIRSDYYTQVYQRCSGRPSGMDDSMAVSLRPDTSYVPPVADTSSNKRKIARAQSAPMKIRLKRTASAR